MTHALLNLEKLWAETIPVRVPTREQFSLWASLHDAETIKYAINETSKKAFQLGGRMTFDHSIRFASSVMNAVKKRQR